MKRIAAFSTFLWLLIGGAALAGQPSVMFPGPGLGASCTQLGNDSFTKSLLHFTGSNGGTTITDTNAGGAAQTWTANGAAVTSTTQFKFSPTSLSTGAGAGYVDTPDSANFTFGTVAAIDGWFYVSGGSGAQRNMFGQADAASANFSVGGTITAANTMGLVWTTTGANYSSLTGTTAITTPGWHWYAVSFTGSNVNLYIDGTREATAAFSGTIFNSANKFSIGRIGENTSTPWNGFLDEWRISVGTDRGWTGTTISVPTNPYCP